MSDFPILIRWGVCIAHFLVFNLSGPFCSCWSDVWGAVVTVCCCFFLPFSICQCLVCVAFFLFWLSHSYLVRCRRRSFSSSQRVTVRHFLFVFSDFLVLTLWGVVIADFPVLNLSLSGLLFYFFFFCFVCWLSPSYRVRRRRWIFLFSTRHCQAFVVAVVFSDFLVLTFSSSPTFSLLTSQFLFFCCCFCCWLSHSYFVRRLRRWLYSSEVSTCHFLSSFLEGEGCLLFLCFVWSLTSSFLPSDTFLSLTLFLTRETGLVVVVCSVLTFVRSLEQNKREIQRAR